MALFTPQQREQLRAELISLARKHPRIAGAAHTGSAAAGREDRWSDIDLALCLAPETRADEVITDWTDRFYRDYQAATHHDLRQGKTLFRVFMLKNTLQVDLAFWTADEFGAVGPDFKLIFGSTNDARPAPQPAARDLIGMAWLYALHVRSSILRGRVWQAEYMLSGMRDHVLALACLRSGLPVHYGRGLDDLPADVKNAFAECLARSLAPTELERVFRSTTKALLDEIKRIDTELANCLDAPLNTLVESVRNDKVLQSDSRH